MTLHRRVTCGYTFNRVGSLVVDRRPDGSIALEELHDPDGAQIDGGPFCRFRLEGAPTQRGAYVITVDDRVVYVGSTQNLAQRFGITGYGVPQPPRSSGPQSTNRRVNRQVLLAAQRGATIDVWFHETDEAANVENWLLWTLDLPWNEKGPTSNRAFDPRPALQANRSNAAAAWQARDQFIDNRAEALKLFADLLRSSPTDGIIYLRRAEAYEEAKDLRAALCDFVVARAFLPIEKFQRMAEDGLRRVLDQLQP